MRRKKDKLITFLSAFSCTVSPTPPIITHPPTDKPYRQVIPYAGKSYINTRGVVSATLVATMSVIIFFLPRSTSALISLNPATHPHSLAPACYDLFSVVFVSHQILARTK